MAEEKDVEFISSHKYMKNTSTCGTMFTEFLLNAGRDLIMPKLQEKNHHITRRIKEKTEIRMGPASLGGSCEKVPSNWETFSSAGRSVRTEKELQRLRGEQSTQLLAVRTERPAQRVLATFLIPQTQVCWCAWNSWVLKFRLQRTDLDKGLGLAMRRQPEGAGVRSKP